MCSIASFNSISFATVTPSLVMAGEPNFFSMMTLRPFGPRVTLTALARVSTPLLILSRASVSKNISFSGQVIWRYNIDSKVFEVFAEGGGNTFNVEFDSKGRLYSGNNGSDRGPYYKQGGYYPRSLGKHGPYTNQYTFGNLDNMELEGEKIRFTHSLIRYEGGKLPAVYEGKMIAVNPLLNYVQLSRFEDRGSTFKNIDEIRI